MKEHQAFTYDNQPLQPAIRRASASREDIEARQAAVPPPANRTTGSYRPTTPHRAGHFVGLHPEDEPYLSQEFRPANKRHDSVPAEEDYPDDPPRRRTSVVIRQPSRATRVIYRQRFRFHWLFFVGIGLSIMIAGWLAFSALSSWWTVQQDDWHYGRPRTYQCDAVVGHGDSPRNPSHFIALNLSRHMVVIEIPGGDPAHSLVYLGPTLLGDGQDLTPVTLSFQDMNGDGKPDMIIHIGDQEIVFLNNGTKFVSPH